MGDKIYRNIQCIHGDDSYRFVETNKTFSSTEELDSKVITVGISLGRDNEDILLCRDRVDYHLTLTFENKHWVVRAAKAVKKTQYLTPKTAELRRIHDIRWNHPGSVTPSEYRGEIPEETLVEILQQHYRPNNELTFYCNDN